MLSSSFPPVADPDARVLILGSLPGPVSLARGQYYAKPQNAFWRIMGVLIGAPFDVPYEARLERVRARGIALWDSCGSAFREGALDSAIRSGSIVANDFASFLGGHPGIGLIGHNGATSARVFAKHVVPTLSPAQLALPRVVLPSTSPALASVPFERKLERWRAFLVQAGVI
jgi:hypoxanthine-DNA glycosylase